MKLKTNYLEKLNQTNLIDLAEFIVKENFKHHADNVLPATYKEDVISVYKEEKNYNDSSSVFVMKDRYGEILGSIRVLKWNYKDVLPIQKMFKINPLMITGTAPIRPIWHIGRFAIRKEIRDISLFKQLMVCAIAPLCESKNGYAFAEIDSKLLRVLKLMGIEATVIGDSIEYLGSETIPVCFTYEGLIRFFNKNKHLLPAERTSTTSPQSQTLPKSVVFPGFSNHYPLV